MKASHAAARPLGSCTLVGAGPGDPELLTLKALKAIQRATLLLVDDLVSAEIVACAPPSARIVHVGKRGGCHSTPQAVINQWMLRAVADGEQVVRLKGGDPFIFGRGGEEVAQLRAAGIEATVVNGISAGLAAATAIGVPLTHREHAHGVLFITGHAPPSGQAGGTDWSALAGAAQQARLTLVIYMGVSNAAHVQRGLLGGLPASTPVAVVQDASRPDQRHLLTRLDQLTVALLHAAITSPAIIVVGDVVGCAALAQEAWQRNI